MRRIGNAGGIRLKDLRYVRSVVLPMVKDNSGTIKNVNVKFKEEKNALQ